MTVEQIHSPLVTNDSISKNESERMTGQDIGLIFAREYYTFLNRKPNRLHAFYGADSLFVRGDEAESVPLLKGQEEIRKRIEELEFDNCKVLVTQVDSQVSSNDGILISVLGEISNKDMPSQKFAETFFLAPQPNGYYILNNIFRFLKEKVDIDYYLCDEGGDMESNKINQSAQGPGNGLPEAKDMKKKELQNAATPLTLLTPLPIDTEESKSTIDYKFIEEKRSIQGKEPTQDQKLIEDKIPIENKFVVDKKFENKKYIEDKKTIKEKKCNELKLAVINNKPTKEVDPVSVKKERTHMKNLSVNNKKVEEQLNLNNSLSSNNKEHTNHKHNESAPTTTKDQSNKNNKKGGVNIDTAIPINNTAGNIVKTWAKLAAPTSSGEPPSGYAESTMTYVTNSNQQNRAQSSQVPYSLRLNVQGNIPDQQPFNMHYNNQNQSTHNHHYSHQQQQTHNYHQHQYNKDGNQQLNQYRKDKETQIFVKNVTPTMTEEQLEEAFSKFGPIKSLNIISNKNCAFIDFGSIESTQKALEQHKVLIGGSQQVYAEERRPPRYNRQQFDNNNRRYQHNRRGGGGSGTTNRGGSGVSPPDKRGGGAGGQK